MRNRPNGGQKGVVEVAENRGQKAHRTVAGPSIVWCELLGGVHAVGGHLGHLAGVGRGAVGLAVRRHHNFSFLNFSAVCRSNWLKI